MLTDLYTNILTDLLFEKTKDFIGIYDLTEERFTRVNEAGVRMLGFSSEEELLADPLHSRSLRARQMDRNQRSSLIARILELGHHQEETEIGCKDGQTFWGELVINAFSAHGKWYALVRLVDQGRLHRAERDLSHNVRRYQAIINSATIGIVVTNEQGKITAVNPMTERLFGYESGQLLNQPVDQLVPLGVSDHHRKLRQSYMAHPEIREMGKNRNLFGRRQDGSVFPVEVSLSYFRLEMELYTVAFVIDITFKKEAERQLENHRKSIEQLNKELEAKVAERTHALMDTLVQLGQSKDELIKALAAERELSELKSRFVAMASHEFRTPLTAVLTSVSLLEKYTESDQQPKRQRHLERIRMMVNHLNDILEEFLSVGKLEEGKVEAHPVAVNVNQLLEEIIDEVRAMLKPGQTIQNTLVCPEIPYIDPSLLRKILINLLSNAIKYSEPGSIVEVQGECTSVQVTLRIRDQGIGIAKADQAHLFERFFRASNVNHIAGTGLGLHIVGRYVGLMGGQIALQSDINQGTTVTVTLPTQYSAQQIDTDYTDP